MTKKDLLALGRSALDFADFPDIPLAEPGTKYHAYLYLLARAVNPGRIVELGTYIGESTKYIAKAAPTAEVITVDINPDARRQITSVEPILPNILAVLDDGVGYAPKYDKRPIDLLFIDMNHDFSLTHSAYEAWEGFVKPGGLIAVDDIHLDAETEKFNAYLKERHIDLIDIPDIHKTGFGIIIHGA